MANVSERGQIILVVGLVLAVMFVALALVLNTAIFTENLATRSNDAESDEAFEFRNVAIASAERAVEYANANNNTDHQTLETSVEKSIADLNNLSARHYARNGKVANVTVVSIVNGTHIEQGDSARDFKDASATPATSWSLASGVTETRDFNMTVSHNSSSCDPITTCFNVTISDGSNEWVVYIDDDGSNNVVVKVYDGVGIQQCTPTGRTAQVNVTAGTVNGTSCDALEFAEGVTGPYTISYNNANMVKGAYELTVANGTAMDDSHYANPSGEPRYNHVVYSTTVNITYKTAELTYSETIKVVPEEGSA